VLLNVLIICAVVVLAPMAAAVLLLTMSLVVTAVSDVRGRGRRDLDDLLRERP
jgi:hypothetical protein